MNCRDARSDIALYAGGDLDDAARVRELRRHVAGCAACRERYHSLKGALKLLGSVQTPETESTWKSAGSLWPKIRRELSRPPQPTGALALQQLRHWSPFVAATAACVLMLIALRGDAPAPGGTVSPRGLQLTPPLAVRPEQSSRSETAPGRPPSPPTVNPAKR